MRLSFILFAIAVALLAFVDVAVAESNKRLRESGRDLKEKETNTKTQLSAAELKYVKAKLSEADFTNEERASGLLAWMLFQGPLVRSKSLDSVEETVRYGRNRIRKPLRFEKAADGKMWVISEKEYQAKRAIEFAAAAKKDKELAENLKGVVKKLQQKAKKPQTS
ncbi:hypothetical protein DVH05_010047 [Phytophthora capsici]|nr:hypothetical protein DVH05_010047 [Phytophthora capsici]|eukprot:jgi/Phyca11/535432/estExt2_fgenesh1_pg.C_PHYCAscaffold_360012